MKLELTLKKYKNKLIPQLCIGTKLNLVRDLWLVAILRVCVS